MKKKVYCTAVANTEISVLQLICGDGNENAANIELNRQYNLISYNIIFNTTLSIEELVEVINIQLTLE